MDNYFRTLGLNNDADINDVKAAYRVLAKKYHPDVCQLPDAERKFVQVNEAYEFLRDEHRLGVYQRNLSRQLSDTEKRRKEAIYNEWVRRQQAAAQHRARANANSSYDAFTRSPVYKTAMILSSLYNYIFLGAGLVLMFAPMMWFMKLAEEEREKLNLTWTSVIFSGIVGVAFTYGIYHFIFKKDK